MHGSELTDGDGELGRTHAYPDGGPVAIIRHCGDNGGGGRVKIVPRATDCVTCGECRTRALVRKPKPSGKRLMVDYAREHKWLATNFDCSRFTKQQIVLNKDLIASIKDAFHRRMTGGSDEKKR